MNYRWTYKVSGDLTEGGRLMVGGGVGCGVSSLEYGSEGTRDGVVYSDDSTSSVMGPTAGT